MNLHSVGGSSKLGDFQEYIFGIFPLRVGMDLKSLSIGMFWIFVNVFRRTKFNHLSAILISIPFSNISDIYEITFNFKKGFSSKISPLMISFLFLMYCHSRFVEFYDYLILLVLLKSPILALIGYKLSKKEANISRITH